MRATRTAAGALLLTGALVLNGCTGSEDESEPPARNSTTCPEEGEPFDGDTLLYIEYNETDGDTGVHGSFGFDGLREVCLRSPDGEQRLLVDPVGPLGDLGINDFFFESREPPLDEYSIEDLKADFPEGQYTVSGTDFEGTPRLGTARFTHDIARGPVITEPRLEDEENAAEAVVPPSGLVVRWEPVTETVDGGPVTVTGYEVIVNQVEWDDPDSQSRPVYDVHVPPDRTQFPVADGFLLPGTLYELEVIVLEESGNQTITVGFFTTSD
jgi:hypothetical protein